MTHEALCPARNNDELPIALQAWSPDCECDLIAKVRADQDRIHLEEMQSLVLVARKARP